jgi:hypothetical protein
MGFDLLNAQWASQNGNASSPATNMTAASAAFPAAAQCGGTVCNDSTSEI